MESNKFDDLVRGAFTHDSRRGVIRTGLGALAGAALTTIGLTADDTAAKKKKKKRCPADLPTTCGSGCCPDAYSKCCVGNLGGFGTVAVLKAAGGSTCNPPSFNCCPVDQGGGSCGGEFAKCCPATTQAPFGSCAQVDATCCPSTAGGFSCRAETPVCCPRVPNDPFEGGYCCTVGAACCQVDADCPGGIGPCVNGCCPAAPREAGADRSSGRTDQSGVERFHMRAR